MIKLRLTEWRTLLRYAIAGAVIVGGGVALGWRAGETGDPLAGPAAKDQWALAAPKEEDVTKDLGALKSLHPWTGFVEQQKPAARPQPPARPTWRLAGIVQRGAETLVLISTAQGQTAKFEYRRVGDSLPDGSILVQITADSAMTRMPASPDSSSSTAAPSSAAPSSDSSPEARTYRLFDKKH
jgi:hypothetical protein